MREGQATIAAGKETGNTVQVGFQRRQSDAILAAVRTGGAPSCTPEEAWRSTAIVQLAMISHSTGRAVRRDEDAACIADDTTANGMPMRDYRSPYRHPAA